MFHQAAWAAVSSMWDRQSLPRRHNLSILVDTLYLVIIFSAFRFFLLLLFLPLAVAFTLLAYSSHILWTFLYIFFGRRPQETRLTKRDELMTNSAVLHIFLVDVGFKPCSDD